MYRVENDSENQQKSKTGFKTWDMNLTLIPILIGAISKDHKETVKWTGKPRNQRCIEIVQISEPLRSAKVLKKSPGELIRHSV